MALEVTALDVAIDSRKAKRGADEVRRELRLVASEGRRTTDSLDRDFSQKTAGSFDRAKARAFALRAAIVSLGGAVVVRGIFDLGRAAFNTASEFEQLALRLETVTGSAIRADAAFDQISKFAARTPFEIQEITEAFVRLSAAGIQPTEDRLRSFGNTASAFGRDIGDFADAVIGAVTGETERLKSFGVIMKLEADKARLIFRGRSQEINRDAASIVAALEEIGATDFAGSMERQADSAAGALSNLSDAWSMFLATLGERSGLLDTVTESVRGLAAGVNLLNQALSEATGEAGLARIDQRLAEIDEGIGAGLLSRITGMPSFFSLEGERQELLAERRGIVRAEREQGFAIDEDADLLRSQQAFTQAEQARMEAEKEANATKQEKIKLLEAETDAAADFIADLRLQTRLQSLDTNEREKVLAVQAAQNAAIRQGNLLRPEQIRLIREEIDAQQAFRQAEEQDITRQFEQDRLADEARRQAERAADEMRRPFIRAADGIQDTFADTFETVLRDGTASFEDFGDRITDIMIGTAAQIAAALVFQPAVGGAWQPVSLEAINVSV